MNFENSCGIFVGVNAVRGGRSWLRRGALLVIAGVLAAAVAGAAAGEPSWHFPKPGHAINLADAAPTDVPAALRSSWRANGTAVTFNVLWSGNGNNAFIQGWSGQSWGTPEGVLEAKPEFVRLDADVQLLLIIWSLKRTDGKSMVTLWEYRLPVGVLKKNLPGTLEPIPGPPSAAMKTVGP